jgi:hypothetical protein
MTGGSQVRNRARLSVHLGEVGRRRDPAGRRIETIETEESAGGPLVDRIVGSFLPMLARSTALRDREPPRAADGPPRRIEYAPERRVKVKAFSKNRC